MAVKGAILCGGIGKRFRPLSFYLQKVMVPVGKLEKPLLEYTVRLFKYYNVYDLVFLVGYKYNQIINYFGDGSRFGVNIRYVRDPEEYKGNGAALYNAYLKGVISEEDTIIVYYGDILSNINLKEMLEFHNKASVTLAVSKGYRVPVGVINVKDHKIVKVEEKPVIEMPVFIGVLIMEGLILPKVKELIDKGKKKIDIIGDILPLILSMGLEAKAYIFDGFWYDVGSLEKFEKLENDYVDKALGFLFREERETQRKAL